MNSTVIENWKHNWFGIWRRGEHFVNCPAVEEFVGNSMPPDDQKEILEFLSSAPVVSAFGGKGKCLLCESLLPVGYQSDGEILWPIDLVHYIEVHAVLLPPKIIEHIRNRQYIAPNECDSPKSELPWPVGRRNRD